MELSVLGPFVILAVLYAINMPVAYCMLTAGFIGILWNSDMDSALGLLKTTPYRHSASFLITTVPMFVLLAEFLSNGRLTSEIFRAASAWLGRIKGGLAMATVMANTGFAAMSGSSTASAASMARVTVPEMKKYGYDERLASGTVAASGTFAAMIPPSVGLIIFGVLTETSINDLFIAGVVPGALTAIGYVILIYFWARFRPEQAPKGARSTLLQSIKASLTVWPAILLVILLLGGIYGGIMTATEAGAVGAFLALSISISLGGLRWPGIRNALTNTVQTTGMILLLIISGAVFGGFLVLAHVAPDLLAFIDRANIPSLAVLLSIIILYLFLGMFMDMIVMMVLTLPLTFPLALEMGYDPLWFGILVIKCGEIGLISPPFGLNVFVTAKTASVSVSKVFSGSARFLIVELCIIVLLVAAPDIVTYLPGNSLR